MDYYKQWDCPRCDGENYQLCGNFVTHNGRPVFDYMMFEQEYIICSSTVFRNYDDDEDWISEEAYEQLENDEREKYYPDECGCEFGTAEIEIFEA